MPRRSMFVLLLTWSRLGLAAGLLVVCSVLLVAQSAKPPHSRSIESKGAAPPVPQEQTYVLVGAGDIVGCRDPRGAEATAKLIDNIAGTVFALGDLVYDARTPVGFQNCDGSVWGRFKERTHPALGNHEYITPTAAAYFAYWGAQAGPPGKGYYSYDLGLWHVVVLNTNCDAASLGGCTTGSPQEVWLRQDLSERANSCILAYGH